MRRKTSAYITWTCFKRLKGSCGCVGLYGCLSVLNRTCRYCFLRPNYIVTTPRQPSTPRGKIAVTCGKVNSSHHHSGSGGETVLKERDSKCPVRQSCLRPPRRHSEALPSRPPACTVVIMCDCAAPPEATATRCAS